MHGSSTIDQTADRTAGARRFRLMTYNVHRCIGWSPFGKTPAPQRIADVIAAYEPDIVALQELDVGRARTGGVDQAHAIACELDMEMHFHPAMRVMEELYGDAILAAFPSRLVHAGPLPGLASKPRLEPRGALWAAIDVGGVTVQVINTHLGLTGVEQTAQIAHLLDDTWCGGTGWSGPRVLAGDFNAWPGTAPYRLLAEHMRDTQVRVEGHKPHATFPSYLPLRRIDHIFVSEEIAVTACDVPGTSLTRRASDHLPLIADLEVLPATLGQSGACAGYEDAKAGKR